MDEIREEIKRLEQELSDLKKRLVKQHLNHI